MKKFLTVLLMAICIFGLTACTSEEEKQAALEYERATAEMCSRNYESAYDLFSALGDYENSAARVQECSQFIIEDLAEAAKLDISKALDEKSSELLIHTILSCQTSPYAQTEITEEIYAFASGAVTDFLKTTEYENFLWFDSLLEAFHEAKELDTDFVHAMDELQESTQMDRSAAFLNAEWIRTENTQNYGLKVESIYDKHKLAVILEDFSFDSDMHPKAHFDWIKGMILMNDITLKDADNFALSCLHLYCYYNLGVQHEYYEDGIGRLDLAHNRILTENTNDKTAEWDPQGDPNIYVRKEYYIPPIALTETDFTVSFQEPVKKLFEAGETDLSKWFSHQNKAFYVYELENTAATSRGISIGSSWDDVVNAYGHGKMNFFQGDSDDYYQYLKQSGRKTPDGEQALSALFSETVQEYMQYEMGDLTLRFYFADDKVTWIFWSGKEF